MIGESPLVRYSVCLMASTLGSVGRTADEFDHRLERIERMVHQNVLPADGREQISSPRRPRPRGGCGVNGGSRKCRARASASSSVIAVRSSGPGMR